MGLRVQIARAVLLAALAIGVAMSPATASAGEYTLGSSSFGGVTSFSMGYTAFGAETNRVTATINAARTEATVEDRGAVIIPGLVYGNAYEWLARCTTLVTSATCRTLPEQLLGTPAKMESFRIELGDGNDRATTVHPGIIRGGPGDDVLEGDLLVGGSGADDLHGWINYEDQYPDLSGTGVTVSLDGVADDGLAGEGDNARPGSTVEGTAAADRLTGDSSGNILWGLAGDDELEGLAGDDELSGAEGADTLAGGSGDDILNPNFFGSDGAVDRVDCGPGDDLVRRPGPEDILIDCERTT